MGGCLTVASRFSSIWSRYKPEQPCLPTPKTTIIAAPYVRAVVTRNSDNSPNGYETLLFCDFGACPLLNLESGADDGVANLGSTLAFTGLLPPHITSTKCAVYDSLNSELIIATADRLCSVTNRNVVSVLAGDTGVHGVGGAGAALYSLNRSFRMAADPLGVIHLLDSNRLRRLQRLAGTSAVTTAPIDAEQCCGLTYDSTSESFLAANSTCTISELLPLGGLKLVAGRPTTKPRMLDGPAKSARFASISDIAADSFGNVFILDGPALRVMMRSDRSVMTLVRDLQELFGSTTESTASGWRLAVLPGDRLLVYGISAHAVLLMQPPELPGRLPKLRVLTEQENTPLADDLGRLLEGPQSDSIADVTIIAQDGRAFPAHRAVLAARCPYYQRQFQSGFGDSSSKELPLPEADPDALAVILHYIYTGTVGDRLQPQLLRPVAALADRLLLQKLSDHAQALLLHAVTPGTVLDDMLWAEQAGLGVLLGHLEVFFMRHVQEVVQHVEKGQADIEALLAGASHGLLKRLLLRKPNGCRTAAVAAAAQ